MNFSCGNNNLQQALSIVEKFIGKKDSLPVLSCIVFDVTKSKVVLRATNLESGCEVSIPAKVTIEGKVAIPGANISSLVRNLKGEHLTFTSKNSNIVSIETPSGVFSIKTLSLEEFPPIPHNSAEPLEIQKNLFIESVRSVISAASTSVIRPEFASVCVSAHNNTLTTVATDSFRLAEKKIPYSGSDIQEILIPLKNSMDILSVLEKIQEEKIQLSVEDGQLSLSVGSLYIVSRITDATFPNYTNILPKNFSTTVTFLKEDIVQALRKAKFFCPTSHQVTITVDKSCNISSHHHDVGEMNESIPSVITGEPLTINFNIPYLLDSFHSISADSVSFNFSGPGKPLIIKGVGDTSFLYLVSPLNR